MMTATRRAPRVERALAGVAILLGALAVVAGSPSRPVAGSVDVRELARTVEQEEDHVTALELARWIRDDKAGLHVIDIRPDSEYGELHIPGATRAALSDVVNLPLDTAATYVLYSEGGTHAAQGWFLLRARGARHAYFLRGGLYEWLEQVMNPRVSTDVPKVERDSIRALTLYFGGHYELVSPDSAGVIPSLLDDQLALPRARGSDTRAAIRRIRKRAC